MKQMLFCETLFIDKQEKFINNLKNDCLSFDEFKYEISKYFPVFDENKLKKYYWDKK